MKPSSSGHRSHRSRAIAALVAAGTAAGVAALLAGCAAMPTSGPIREAGQGNAAEQPVSDSQVRVFANPPQAGMSPIGIVEGFLNAMNSVEPSFDTAKLYLASADEWDPSERVVVYDESDRTVDDDPAGGVRMDALEVGRVSADGAYRPATPGAQVSQRFELVERDGEWRIRNPPPGVFVSELDFTREYVTTDEPLNLYFYDPSFRVLVPDPIYLPKRADLLTAVTQAVLRGPTGRLGDAVVSAVPTGTELLSRPVTLVNGQITVALDQTAANLDQHQRELLTAQLVWSLSTVSESPAQVTAGGQPLYPQSTSTSDWEQYRPGGPVEGPARGFALRDGILSSLDVAPGADPQPVPVGGSGDEMAELAAFAVSPGGPEQPSQVAGVSADRKRLIRARLDAPRDAPKVVLRGTQLESPSWDAFGGLWVLDQQEAGTKVYFVDAAGRHDITVAGLGLRRIIELAVSADGTRMAMITQEPDRPARLELGLVKTTEIKIGQPDEPQRSVRPVSITSLSVVAPQLDAAMDVAWADAQQLVVLIRAADTDLVDLVEPYQVGVDGRMPEQLGGPVSEDPVTVAAGPGAPVLVGTKDGKIYRLPAPDSLALTRSWEFLTEGRQPAYPG
ncbi:MAG: LpqB family beta-propeller domain-containing protein [Sporichthyaceae bacterium]|nr:LpqB family beta-propeller domain-containing protein [Sporichthyaceae bacterium]